MVPGLERWRSTWKELGAPRLDQALFDELIARYSEPHRRYHTVRHLEECLARLPEVRAQATRPAEVELAIWFHDAVYDPRRQDNEGRSAEWARSAVLGAGLSADLAGRVHALVRATRHEAASADPDAQLVADIDLAILGAEAERFDEYERQVREEYAWVPEAEFRRRRRQVLERFAARPRIFATEHFHELCEARARENIARSLGRLGG